jgi:hypothetical protein
MRFLVHWQELQDPLRRVFFFADRGGRVTTQQSGQRGCLRVTRRDKRFFAF